MLFKCKHPFDELMAGRPQTVKSIDAHYDHVTQYFVCGKCGKRLKMKFAQTTPEFWKVFRGEVFNAS